jgi:hypothetical protein
MMEPESRRGLSSGLVLPIAGIVVLVIIIAIVAVMCTGGSSGSDEPEPTATTVVTPTVPAGSAQESALAPYVQSTLGSEYAGSCAQADASATGKICSVYRGERDGVHAFVLGMTLSEGDEWVFVQMQSGAWRVVASTPITAESSAVPGIPWPLKVGAEVVVIGTGSCLNVRTEPGGDAVDCITEGTAITLAAGPQEAQDREWWRVEGRDGWVAATYLRYPDSTTDELPTATPAPTGEATPEATAAP